MGVTPNCLSDAGSTTTEPARPGPGSGAGCGSNCQDTTIDGAAHAAQPQSPLTHADASDAFFHMKAIMCARMRLIYGKRVSISQSRQSGLRVPAGVRRTYFRVGIGRRPIAHARG